MIKSMIKKVIRKLLSPVMGVSRSLRFPHIFGSNKEFDAMFAEEVKRGLPYTKSLGRKCLGYVPELDRPATFNEKLIHRRLFNRDPIWPVVTDKIAVRDWLSEHGLLNGLQLITCLAIFDDVNEFMPRESDFPFVVKAAWASGYNIFVQNSAEWGKKQKQKLERWQIETYAPHRLIWAAQHINRRFIVEKMIFDGNSDCLKDFKFFVFHGKFKLLQVHIDRGAREKIAHFDEELSPITVSRKGKEFNGLSLSLPPNICDAVAIAEAIGSHFDFVRVDLYVDDCNIYFGEITQTPASGFGAFDPPSFDAVLGEYWNYHALKPHYVSKTNTLCRLK